MTKGRARRGRHQATLRAAIDWSHDLCTDDEQRLLRRLAVFHGGWSLEAAQAISADDRLDEWDILDLLTRLTDRSLVEIDARDTEQSAPPPTRDDPPVRGREAATERRGHDGPPRPPPRLVPRRGR